MDIGLVINLLSAGRKLIGKFDEGAVFSEAFLAEHVLGKFLGGGWVNSSGQGDGDSPKDSDQRKNKEEEKDQSK